MKKIAALLIILLAVATVGFCDEIKFKDMSDNHWAAPAVYTAVKTGLMTGYPDGTFRGNKTMSRYEAASVISKLAERAGTVGLKKLSEELKIELKAIKSEIAKMSRSGGGLSGIYETNLYVGNLLGASKTSSGTADKGPAVYYRLRTWLERNVSDNASIKVNLDTMDSGFFGGDQSVSTRLFDVEGKIRASIVLQPLDILVTNGPGTQKLTSTSEVYQGLSGFMYVRPWNSLNLSTEINGVKLSAGYAAHNVNITSSPGKAAVNEIKGSLSFGFKKVPAFQNLMFNLSANQFTVGSGVSEKSTVSELTVTSNPSDKVELSGTFGTGGSDSSSMAVFASLFLNDPFNSGNFTTIKICKIGSSFLKDANTLDSWWMTGSDVFGRTIPQGIVDIGADVTQNLSDRLAIKIVGDVRLSGNGGYGETKAGSSMTYEGSLLYSVAEAVTLRGSYMLFFNPTNTADKNSDMLTLGFKYNF